MLNPLNIISKFIKSGNQKELDRIHLFKTCIVYNGRFVSAKGAVCHFIEQGKSIFA